MEDEAVYRDTANHAESPLLHVNPLASCVDALLRSDQPCFSYHSRCSEDGGTPVVRVLALDLEQETSESASWRHTLLTNKVMSCKVEVLSRYNGIWECNLLELEAGTTLGELADTVKDIAKAASGSCYCSIL